ncbi:MAG: ParM/StbA family protein [Cyanobacteria bacterium P01_A01_bin.40]
MSKIFLCIDPGGSQTKVIYQLTKDKKPRYFLMSPEVEEISRDNLKRYLDKQSPLSNPSPLRQAYLEVNKRTFVIGYFANKFDPEDRLQEIKYENALYKTLAAVGVIIEQNNLNPKKLSLQLAILLPWNEYEDRQKFFQKLAQYLNNFSFRGLSYSVKLERSVCRPEGGGLAAIYTRKRGSQWQQSKKLGILMFGHRNITALYFKYGDLRGESPLYGFSGFLDNVIARTSGLDRERIASAIFKGLESDKQQKYENYRYAKQTFYPNWVKLDAFEQLANAKDSDLRQTEIDCVDKAIDVATDEYWSKLSKWLGRVFDSDLDEVVISGGASRFLETELERYFNCAHICEKTGSSYLRTGEYEPLHPGKHFTPIVWGAGFTKEIEEILALSGKFEAENSLSYRLVDAYGLFDHLIATNQKRVKKTPKKNTEHLDKAS